MVRQQKQINKNGDILEINLKIEGKHSETDQVTQDITENRLYGQHDMGDKGEDKE